LARTTKFNAKYTELVDEEILNWDPDSYLIKVVILYIHCGSADNL
jgi:hypothetical protein